MAKTQVKPRPYPPPGHAREAHADEHRSRKPEAASPTLAFGSEVTKVTPVGLSDVKPGRTDARVGAASTGRTTSPTGKRAATYSPSPAVEAHADERILGKDEAASPTLASGSKGVTEEGVYPAAVPSYDYGAGEREPRSWREGRYSSPT